MTGEDFAAVDVCHDTYENSKKFQFRSYAPKVFTKLRQLINLDEESYRSSMVPSQGLPYLEFLSNSKSGMSFFLCNNKMLMIKTEKPDDITFFRSILKQYLHHFEKYPHSLMVKILGLHYIHVEGHKPRYFTVMQSVFFPDERIFERYDLKGCHASRYTEPEPEGSQIITILKDNNLKGTTINIGSQREWFLTQIQHDTNFLAEIGVMDYSLLLGRQHIHYTERREEDKFADIVLRLQKSVPLKTSAFGVLCEKCKEQNRLALANDKLQIRESGDSDSQGCEEIETKRESDTQQAGQSGESRNGVRPGGCTTPSSVDVNSDLPKADGDSRNSRSAKKLFSSAINTDTVLPGMIPGTPKISSASEEDTNETTSNQIVDFDKVKERNQRLLPDIENALHVIDGEEERYFLGIIDIFTQYKMKKKLEHVYKAFRFPCTSFSTVAPVAYAGRFRNFMEEHSE
ncbi:phosphatidylinositol 4-phosphate 5-kinase-like protein 1 [Glandiceps talaboti]